MNQSNQSHQSPQSTPETGGAAKVNCTKCGTGNLATAKFCNDCGAKMEIAGQISPCAKCGAQMQAGSKFCNECGTKVESGG